MGLRSAAFSAGVRRACFDCAPVDAPEDVSDVRVHRIKKRSGFLSPLITQQFGVPGLKAAQLRSVLDEHYDVVNFHNISLVGGPGVIRLSEAKVNLFTLHEHWLLCPTHIFWKNGKAACDKRECFSCSIRSGIPPQLWRYTSLMKKSLEGIDQFIAPSDYTAKIHRELLDLAAPIDVIPLFSNLSPEPEPPSVTDRLEFLYVGRMTNSKGVAELLTSFSKWPQYDLVLIGDGEMLEQWQRNYAQFPNIRFTGGLPQARLIEHYRRACALILPSLAPETFGLTVVEAFACGTPAIVRIAGGNRETIDSSSAGFLYSDEPGLRAAIEEFAADPQLRIKLGLQARKSYEERYTEDVHVSGYLNLVESTMQKKPRMIGVG
jgi:glycosyltransferase involved in cell wall biosynthesis